jgi:hypothetical protein
MSDQSNSDIVRELVYLVIGGIAVVSSNIFIRRLLPSIPDDFIHLLSYLLLALGLFIFLRGRRFLLPLAFTVIGILITVSLFRIFFAEERTVYFVIDASSNMRGRFEQIRSRIELQAMGMPADIDYGLAVFGGHLSGEVGCNDITALVPPLPKDVAVPEISRAVSLLVDLEPRGVGALQEAVLHTIDQLEGRRGIQQIFVITSAIDAACDPLDRAAIEDTVNANRIEVELIVVSVGALHEPDALALEHYADRYIPLETAVELPAVIEEVVGTPPLPYGAYGSPYSLPYGGGPSR